MNGKKIKNRQSSTTPIETIAITGNSVVNGCSGCSVERGFHLLSIGELKCITVVNAADSR
ncbi:hypothetical protein BLOT_011404 [Blomia tropicalis]|nr:hypothetical protein BLOT_011404 [Blomia tropicalis]